MRLFSLDKDIQIDTINYHHQCAYRGRTTFEAVGGRAASRADITESHVCGL